MRRCFVLLTLTVTLISLTGCSGLESYLEKRILQRSGITKKEEYIEYQGKLEEGKIDEEGYYLESENPTESAAIHITFSKNNNLNIVYYADKDHRNQIDTTNYYLNPGDSIFAEVSKSGNVNSSAYDFSTFNITEYDDEGNRTPVKDLEKWNRQITPTDMGYEVEVTIPSWYKGTELSIEPQGEYERKKISLYDYYTDDDGHENSLNGTWYINENECTDDIIEINPISSYIISYRYDTNEYFYSSSTPQCFYQNNEDGIIIFPQREAMDETKDYSVELHNYLTINITSGIERSVAINGENRQIVKANTELSISKLKYGDKVILETDRAWEDLETNRELILISTEQTASGNYRYTLIVPEKEAQFVFDPSEYSYEHGTIIFKCFGEKVTGKQYLAKGSKIYYETGTADEGYWLPDNKNYIVVTDEEETKAKLEEIHFVEKKLVSLSLGQPAHGGKIVYRVDGKIITAPEYEVFTGTVITMDFEPLEGWICSSQDGAEFIVEENDQEIRVNEKGVNEIFSEDEEHKPKLSVVLKKSLGEDIEFEIEAPGWKYPETKPSESEPSESEPSESEPLESEHQPYEQKKGWLRHDLTIANGVKIGTEEPIKITMRNKAIPPGKAVKIEVKKVDSEKQTEISEVRYVVDLTKRQDPIDIYERENSKIWYRTININIGIVDITEFEQPDANKNTTVSVYNADTKKELKQGDLIEESQKVIVKISPVQGYYVLDGNHNDDTEYQDTLKYSKYVKEINKLIENHGAEKICSVRLDESDPFAKYTYQYKDKPVSGSLTVKAGEKLTLEYEIMDSEHKLTESAGGFLGIGKTDKKVKKTIEITADMDGKAITKSDFGIEVGKGE